MGLPMNDPDINRNRMGGQTPPPTPPPQTPTQLPQVPQRVPQFHQQPQQQPNLTPQYDPFSTVQQQLGPDALAQNTQAIYKQLVNSPFYRAQIGQILANQGTMMPGMAAAQGQAGTSQTGVGQAKQTLGSVAGQMQGQQLAGDMYGAALGAAQQNLGMQAGFLPGLHQVQQPGEYSPMQLQADRIAAEKEMQQRGFDFQSGLQASSQEHQQMMANLSHSQQTYVMQLANDLQMQLMRYGRDLEKEWSWGDFFSGVSSFIPFL